MRVVLSCIAILALGVPAALGVPMWRASPGFDISNSACVKIDTTSNHNTRIWHDDVLGDLIIDDSWYHENRPLNECPFTREHINTRFILHTNQEPGEFSDTFIMADKDVIDATTFDPSKPIKFISHGFIDTGNCNWLKDMARSMLRYGDFNVIRVNWGGGSLPLYCQAAANTRVVGLEIAHLVNFFVENYGVDPANIHLLGHSLGSHVSGYAGEKISGLGRITGMDPAGPYYTELPTFVRLDESDADFVDCIHTDAKTIFLLGYGSEQAMGNLDFYPNRGYNQPGCDPVSIGIQFIINIPEGARELAACSHQRSVELVTDSFDDPCPYVGHECVDYDTFEYGRCVECGEDDSKCAAMGIFADQYKHKDRVNVKMYLDTDKEQPFCYYHYQVVFDLAHPKHAADSMKGDVVVWMYGDNGEMIEKLKLESDDRHFIHGNPKYFLMKSHTDLSKVIRMEVKWDYDILLTEEGSEELEEDDEEEPNLFDHHLYVRSIHVSPLDHTAEADRLTHTTNLCEFGHEYTEIASGHTKSFAADDSCVFE